LLSSPIRATCPAHFILLDFTTHTILGKEYRYISWFILYNYITMHGTKKLNIDLMFVIYVSEHGSIDYTVIRVMMIIII
jgi:hypothetical protein